MTQLELPISGIDPRIQLQAARRLQRMVEERRNSFEIRDFAKRRQAMLRHTRSAEAA